MKIQDDGKLVVNFRTEVRFRGQFVLQHPGTVGREYYVQCNKRLYMPCAVDQGLCCLFIEFVDTVKCMKKLRRLGLQMCILI